MAPTIFDITWPKNAQIELCFALDNSEFRQLFNGSVGLRRIIEISCKKLKNKVVFLM